ncbi:DUF2378 family protein [Hyalangium gracile]|uniref:DUF2378 family protein n=1 Tax=Hyalangium gracile TaxID=394092 RepID=UPI001CCD98C7|nr:DUF2378 family protein [Hyalangium gracile]
MSGTLPLRAERRRVVFDHTVEGLFLVALRGRLSVTAESSLRRAGLDLSKKLLPAYPFETWKHCLEIVATDLYPHLTRPQAWQEIGRAMVEGMARTVIGKATVGVARLLGPLRALRRLEHTLQSADNYVEARVTERSPTCVEVWINEVMGQPTYYQGILEACLSMTGAQGGRVELLSCSGGSASFRVQWEE